MSDNDKPRVYLGDRAVELIMQFAAPDGKINGRDLEKALQEYEKSIPTEAERGSEVTELMRSETDQLYRELTVEIRTQGEQIGERLDKIEGHMEALAKSVDAIRIMLNIFGEELGQADTSALFKEANELMTNVLVPLARERKSPVIEQAKSEDDTRGSQREEADEIQQKEDADLEMNGHAVLKETKEQSSTMTRDEGRA